MKYSLITFSFILVMSMSIGASKPKPTDIYEISKEKKYLPICLDINNYQTNDFYVFCSIYLKTKGIKIISRQDAKDISEQEVKSVIGQYFNNSDENMLDFESMKRRMAFDLSYVVNQLSIKIKFDSVTNKIDSFAVSNFPLPVNLGNPYIRKWKNFDLSKIDTLPLANFAVAVSDSILTANILLKEK
ncbi:hypothetical protein [Ferruginibacter sp.]|nr:hypothetical protein [Ferruginibacter sp.]